MCWCWFSLFIGATSGVALTLLTSEIVGSWLVKRHEREELPPRKKGAL